MEVPTATSLRDIYPEDALPVETKRWESLLAKFTELYGKQADFVARSPGRVNIIGEVNYLQEVYYLSLMIVAHRLLSVRGSAHGHYRRLHHGRSCATI